MKLFAAGLACACIPLCAAALPPVPASAENLGRFNSTTEGVRIYPGSWRPHYNAEQIAWVSPPWKSPSELYGKEYVFLDFPEAIFVAGKIVYLSHVHPRFPGIYNTDLPSFDWRRDNGSGELSYERTLPNGLTFGGALKRTADSAQLTLWIKNGTGEDLNDVRLQTCAYLHQLKEFDAKTDENKFVRVKGRGWISLEDAKTAQGSDGDYFVGWLGGAKILDLPVIVTVNKSGDRAVGFTWFGDTYSFVGNSEHPCMHADPTFGTIRKGETKTIRGELFFTKGTIEDAKRAAEARVSRSR